MAGEFRYLSGKNPHGKKQEVKMENKQKIHYAWFILVGCCILQGASLGLVNNCAGVFYSPVCQDLGFEMGKFTFYRMLFSISSALALPMVAACMRKMDVRIVISTAAVVFGVCNVAMGSFHELWQWYVTGLIQGVASSFLCMIPAPILLANWFHKKTGTAVGIAAAFSGLLGMVGSSGLGFTIPAFGWRASYVIVGLLSMAMILPISLFVLRYRPEDKNMRAYGAAEEESGETGEKSDAGTGKKGMGLKEFLKQPVFYVALLAYACSLAGSYLNMFLTSCGLSAGLPMKLAAMMTTLALLGNMSSKLVLGKSSDTFGVIRTLIGSVLIAEAGHFLLFLGIGKSTMVGALLFGVTPPLSSVMLPLFCKMFWKGETYGTAYSYVSMFGTLLVSPFNSLFGYFYDVTGTYRLTIGVSGFLVFLVIVTALLGEVLLKRETLRVR